MKKQLLIGAVAGALMVLGATGIAQADHRGCDYGYSIGGTYAARSYYAAPTYQYYAPRTYYYAQPSYGYYSPGLHLDFGFGGHYYGHGYGGHGYSGHGYGGHGYGGHGFGGHGGGHGHH